MKTLRRLVLALTLGGFSSAAVASPLDPTFGWQGGMVVTGGGQDSVIFALGSPGPGGTVLLLSKWSGASASPDGGLTLLELSESGIALEKSEVFTGCASDGPKFCVGAMLRDRQGRVLIAGQIIVASSEKTGLLSTVQRLVEGRPDPSFGTDGFAKGLPAFAQDGPTALLERKDGRLWVAGRSVRGRWQLGRLLENGQPDPTLGGVGFVELNLRSDTSEFPTVLLERPDGALLVIGSSMGSLQGVQVRPDGSLDSRFGKGGVWNGPSGFPLEGRFNAQGFVLLTRVSPPSRFELLTGRPLLPTFTPELVRVRGDGSSATVTRFPGVANVARLDRQGFVWTARGENPVIIERFTPDGRVHSTYGTGGRAKLTSAFALTQPQHLLEQQGGKILLVGNVSEAGGALYTSVDIFLAQLRR